MKNKLKKTIVTALMGVCFLGSLRASGMETAAWNTGISAEIQTQNEEDGIMPCSEPVETGKFCS